MKKQFSKMYDSPARTPQSLFKVLMLLIFSCIGQDSIAQGPPINGSGKIVQFSPELNGFDKVSFSGMNGRVFIESGKPFKVDIRIDDNLASLLKYEVQNGELKFSIEGNKYNRRYLENTNINIRVAMPEISVFEHEGNGKIEISGIYGRYFRLKKDSNADASISGPGIDKLDIVNAGNGDINAGKLLANSVKIKKSGNGDVIFNTNNTFSVVADGNGDIINKGNGAADNTSRTSGNGKIITAALTLSKNDQEIIPQPRIEKGDLSRITGNWNGELTYLDYTSKKEVTFSCNLEAVVTPDEKLLKLKYIYPDEMDANTMSRLDITEDGATIEGQFVMERTILPDGSLKLITEEKEFDDYKLSTIRRIIVLSNDTFVITKMVKFDDAGDFFRRNEYRWKKS
jgi:hypothetical protein